MPSFDLVDDPWVPCTMLKDGSHQELGLNATLTQAPDIREVVDPSPLVTVALHRLLLAILHRNFGPSNSKQWHEMWNQRRWDSDVLKSYFLKWGSRFDLFDDEHPFCQARSLAFEYERPISILVHDLASGNNATLFDHSIDSSPRSLSPAQCARYLLAHQAFTVVGFVWLEKGQDPKLFKSAKAGPLAKGAVALVRGGNLFETLMLNLHCYSRENGRPFPFGPDDLPAWERDEETQAGERYPAGYLDLLTWQSRRVRLRPELESSGETVVRKVVIMKGNQFPDGFSLHEKETMLAFIKHERAQAGQDPWPVVGFEEERALWRDSHALFGSMEGASARPKLMDWLSELTVDGAVSRSLTLPADFCGVATDKAKVLFWRHERLPVPLAYLDEKELRQELWAALQWAEQAGRVLRGTTHLLAELILPSSASGRRGKDPAGDLARSLAPWRLYWSQLEVPFKELLVNLPGDKVEDYDGVEYGRSELPEWRRTVRRAAIDAFEEVARSLDTSGRTLKGVATAERVLHSRLNEALGARQKP